MLSILQSTYVVLAATSYLDLYYVNNYIDWDQFNTLYIDIFFLKKLTLYYYIKVRINGKSS